jgi:hypothetical protein
MKTVQTKKKSDGKLKSIAITSLVWIIIGVFVVAALEYAQYREQNGMLKGFENAKSICQTK